MNNSFDGSTSASGNSQFDDLMQSLGIDLHQNISTPDSHSHLHDNSQPQNPLPDNIHHTGTPDFTHTNWVDSSHSFSQHPQSDTHHSASQWYDTEHGFASSTHHHQDVSAKPQVLNCASSHSGDGPYIHIDRSGDVHLHKLDGTTKEVGYVRGQEFYNSAHDHIGDLGKDGHVYRWKDDTSVGRVESGHIYRENGAEIGRADTDLEGAAHMLFVVRGGTP